MNQVAERVEVNWREVAKAVRHRFRTTDHTVEEVLEWAERHFGLPTHGVEGWGCDVRWRTNVQYLNTGDSYGTTILVTSEPWECRRVYVTSYGDFLERTRKFRPEE